MTEKTTQDAECLSRLTAELGTTSDEQQLAAALMPCGAVVSNVYEAYNAGAKAERERWLKMDIVGYLVASSESSMSRNNRENLAAEILQYIDKLPSV